MKLTRILTGIMAGFLATAIAATGVVTTSDLAAANTGESPSITLNGTVVEGAPGYLTSKSIIMTSAEEARLNYRLVPNYSSGFANKVTVTLFMPSLALAGDQYVTVDRDAAPTPMGVQGRVSAGGGWEVVSDTTAKGGKLVMEYIGDLGAGVNPAFDLFLSTYNDGTSGPYGGVPEGTAFDIHGYVEYETFNGAGDGFETIGRDDIESHVQVIATDLKWEPYISAFAPGGGSTVVPMWDRFQYFDYIYELKNTSTNPASNVESYTVNFDIQTTDDINGIIRSDINRHIYNGGGAATENMNPDYTEGQFIGVPGEGGVLIYDVTDVYQDPNWDGKTGLGEPIPYAYDGTGMVSIDRHNGDNRDRVTPGTERVYMLSLPMSRQGFPNIPTQFKVTAITNIILGESTNWSKTKTAVREVVTPSYGLDFTHTPEKPQPVYALETFTEIAAVKNTSNVPVFNPSIEYTSVENFDVSHVVYLMDKAVKEQYGDAKLSYAFTNDRGKVVERNLAGQLEEDQANPGTWKLVFDISELDGKEWDYKLKFHNFTERMEPGATLPVAIQVHGMPMEVKQMTFPAVTTYVERYANNEDFTAPTTYAEVPHTARRDASFEVIMPSEVRPRTDVKVSGASNTSQRPTVVDYASEPTLSFNFGTNDQTAETSSTTITVNTPETEAIKDAVMVIKPELFVDAGNVRIKVVALDGEEQNIDFEGMDLSQNAEIALPDGFAKIIVDTDTFHTSGAKNFIDVIGTVGAGLKTSHTVSVKTDTYQGAPYDRTNTSTSHGYLQIKLPNDLNPSTSIIGIYGDRRTTPNTSVPYEAQMQAEYRLSTGGVNAPEFTYTITMDEPSKLPAKPTDSSGVLFDTKLALTEAFLAAGSDFVTTFIDDEGNEQEFTTSVVDYADIDLDNIAEIVISGKNLKLDTATPIVIMDYDSELDMGARQVLRATFDGTPQAPFVQNKTASAANTVEVAETRTTLEIEGVNQVTKPSGAGNSYDQWVDRQWSCGYYCTKNDLDLDQGYKSLGGFASTIHRPTSAIHNNDQTLVVDVNMPHEQFDMYYMKVRDDLKPFIKDVQIFRMVDGEEQLWRTISGDAWTNNTAEGTFWRINTGHQDVTEADLFTSMASANEANHPYYKHPFADNVVPDQPVSRVSLTMEFTREGPNAAPQLPGTESRVVEYMGRFFETTEDAKKATTSVSVDTFGKKHPIERAHTPAPVYSIVHYPFAQTRTGAHDNTSLARKVITMGNEGNYLASIWNVATQNWSYNAAHGPDIYVPVNTYVDEWMNEYDPESFHDKLAYEFVYPANPATDENYNLDATHITFDNTSVLRYITSLRIDLARGDSVTLEIDDALRTEILTQPRFRVEYDNTLDKGFHKVSEGLYKVSLGGDGIYPTKFEAMFEEVAGFGDNTAELQGVAKDSLGANLNEVDVRVGGIVNGNKDLKGTTNLYREPNDTERKLVHTSSAILAGYTPTLGAAMDMKFDKLSLYDYGTDGITPNTSTVEAGMRNNAESDITAFSMNVAVDTAFRAQGIKIPASIFDGVAGDWKATKITIGQPGASVDIDLERFTLVDGNYVLDLEELFADGTLETSDLNVRYGGESTLDIRRITLVTADFEGVNKDSRMWGTLAREVDPALPDRMIPESYISITGDWVDEVVDDDLDPRKGWDSKPSFRAQGTHVTSASLHTGSFTASASQLRTPQKDFRPASSGLNGGTFPALTLNQIGNAPTVRHRVVHLQLHGAHLNEDLELVNGQFPYDADTDDQVAATDLVVGDTTKVLYEIRNAAEIGDETHNDVFDPSAHFAAPTGMKITGVTVVTADADAKLHQAIAELGRTNITLSDDQFSYLPSDDAEKGQSIQFSELVMKHQESVFVFVEYEAINDYGADRDATQDKTVVQRSYASPGLQHHIQNFDAQGVSGRGVSEAPGTEQDFNQDGFAEKNIGVSTSYKYAHPTVIDIKSTFDVESLSGTPMTLTVDKMSNQIRHDNTYMIVDVALDTRADGFELTELPEPAHHEGYDDPKVFVRISGGDWVTFDEDGHELADVTHIRVDYGFVTAYDAGGNDFAVPAFEIRGTGWWQNSGGVSTKSSQITSTAQLSLTHHDGSEDDNPAVARYMTADTDTVTIYKGLPQVEFNLQSFDDKTGSTTLYSDNTAPLAGKTSYLPGEHIYLKLSARNANTAPGVNTGMGKAPVLDPVIFDKIPEYMKANLQKYVSGNTLDVAAAVAGGALIIKHYDKDGNEVENLELPTVTVEGVTGLDIAGDQEFAGNRHNDRSGLLSNTAPDDAAGNPAREITFQVYTYEFARDLGRGERIEVMYEADIREEGLPYATYKDGRPVYAPMLGWYGSNDLTAASANGYDMDMAALLHDAGFSGTRRFEQTEAEFLASSSTWVPGQTRERRTPDARTGTIDTYYDASANSMYTHKVFLHELPANTLFLGATDGAADDNFKFVNTARVNDGKVEHHDRVLWAQDNLQLSRAWIYGASEMLPAVERTHPPYGRSDANFIEHDGSLVAPQYVTPYTADNYSYAVEMHEELTVRLHAANLGDRAIESGIQYTEILPVGFNPFDKDGFLIGINAFDGAGTELGYTYKVLQTPEDDKGFRAPAQNQEATHKSPTGDDAITEDAIPYVLQIEVATPLTGMFKNAESTMQAKYQHVDVKVRVDKQAPVLNGERSYWFDQLTVTSIDEEPYMAAYSKEYGAFNVSPNSYNQAKFPNDGVQPGIDLLDLSWYHWGSSGYTTYYSFEPYGMYIRGMNAQGTATTADGKVAVVTGDQMVMRAPTMRVWNDIEKDSYANNFHSTLQDFTAELGEQFTIHATAENQQIETSEAYASGPGAENEMTTQPQTVGGARGTWFDPTMTVVLPYGVVPVLENGRPARYTGSIENQQQVSFTAAIDNVTYKTSEQAADVSEHLDLRVERIQSDQGERFVLFFTIKDNEEARAAMHRVSFGQSLVVSPRAMVVDVPSYTKDETVADKRKYQEIITLANSELEVFNPLVTSKYSTGSTPNGPAADRERRDSTGTSGAKKITDRLISATKKHRQGDNITLHTSGGWTTQASSLLPGQVVESETNTGAYGGTRMALRYPNIVNTTKVGPYADGADAEVALLSAANKFWVSTQIDNSPVNTSNPYDNILTAGTVHNSRFVVSSYVTSFAEKTGEVRLKVGGELLKRSEFEDRGYTVEAITENERIGGAERQVVRWVVTTPAGGNGNLGHLASGGSVILVQEYRLVDGFEDDELIGGVWRDPAFNVDTYVSLIADDLSLLGGGNDVEDFVVQPLEPFGYQTRVSESSETGDIDGDKELTSFFAQNDAGIEIAKPQGEIRINTTRPRMEYSNGSVGDPYFNGSDTIEYMVTLAKNTGSGLREMVVDSTLPSYDTKDSDFDTTKYPIETTLRYVSSGKWEIPKEVVEHIEKSGKSVDEVFETEVFVSDDEAEAGFESGNWVSLGKSSIGTDTVFDVPEELQRDRHKVRVIVRSLDADYLVPSGTRLAIDADADNVGSQEVTETDPGNRSVAVFGEGVTGSAVKIGMRVSSDMKQTMFIYNRAELWGNYVAGKMGKLDQAAVRSYLTPSRPVINVLHSAEYYRYDNSYPPGERWGWDDNMALNPTSSPHLKFRGEVVNADETMWNEEEKITYSEDMLIDPKITFELPHVMSISDGFKYVPNEEVTEDHPLHDDHRGDKPLPRMTTATQEQAAFQWTWKLVAADGTVKQEESNLKHTRIYSGEWDGMDRNVVTVWFEGEVLPGDKIVIDFIGLVETYTPGATSEDTKSRVYATNNTGLVQPLNSGWNKAVRLGYESDRHDLDGNDLLNDRLVFNEQILFEYEVYDNFGKRKVATSDLNEAGTVYPRITQVREGGDFSYALTVDNTKEEGEKPYPYPIMYDVLPFVEDTSILNSANVRNSAGSSVLNLDSFKLVAEGGLNKTYAAREYTMYVGPFTRQGGQVVEAERVPHAVASTEAFYNAVGIGGQPSAEREKYFVSLADFKAAVAADPSLLGKVQSVLMLFNNPTEQLPGQSKLKLTFDMSTPLNAPAFLERWNTEGKPEDVAQWNSFVATQRQEKFLPQESNNAGTFVTERSDRVSIGNYVWHDANYDAEQDEGEIFADVNGRQLLRPTKDIDFDGDIDDAGINQVKVTLLSPYGRHVDYLGNAIKQVGNTWFVVDDETGEVSYDELNQTTESEGPLVTTTRTDINGWNGYYVFSNVVPGDYRVMFEMPKAYDGYSVTTQQMISGADVTTYEPGVAADVQVAHDASALVAVTDVRTVSLEAIDDVRMGFDLGVGRLFDFGGTVWNDKDRDGVIDAGEDRLEGYKVALKTVDGKGVLDVNGNELVTTSDELGEYVFPVLPRENRYYVQVTHPGGSYVQEMPVTPITHAENPFTRVDDNDVSLRGTGGAAVVRTNLFSFDLKNLFETDFADRMAVNAGFYDYQNTGVIGNLVWDDKNRNGIQEAGEPGIEGQELTLEQYELVDGEWVKNDDFVMTATSQADGLYYFADVPAFKGTSEDGTSYGYQVVIEPLSGFTFAPVLVADDREVDSDFFMNGKMHEGAVGDHLISLTVQDGRFLRAIDNVTIDLGLMAHDTGVIAGEIFIDKKRDGTKTGDPLGAERYTATLQRSIDGENWAAVASQQAVNSYRFEGLTILDEASWTPFQYRVVVTEIPLWLTITERHTGDDDGIDNDFVEIGREGTYTALSDTYILGDLIQGQLHPIDTREAVDHEEVDLGLLEPNTVIGGRFWEDANANGIQDEGEESIQGEKIVLWELIDGTWTKAGDENADKTVSTVSDENGEYRFAVSPLHYEDEAAANFMQPREYRVTAERDGWQKWSPLNVGDDRLVDSDIMTPATVYGFQRTGVTNVFSIIDHENGVSVPTTMRSDVQMDIGVTTYANSVTIGGVAWVDANEDGKYNGNEDRMADREVILWEKVGGQWVIAEDMNGDSVKVTDELGYYGFEVSPTHYGEGHPGYMLPREYRTTMMMPDGYRLSIADSVTTLQFDNEATTLEAFITEVDEDGNSVLTSFTNDLDLDFPFVPVPVEGGLEFTGGEGLPFVPVPVEGGLEFTGGEGFPFVPVPVEGGLAFTGGKGFGLLLLGALGAGGLGILLLLAARRRKKEEEVMQEERV